LPSKGLIQATDFQALLQQLGVNPNNIPFDLRSEVTPVVLVGGTVSFLATPTPAYRVPDIFTNGVLVAPVINTILADTGPLLAGEYTMLVEMHVDEQNSLRLEWRNALNTVNLWLQRFTFPAIANGRNYTFTARLSLDNDNERVRVSNVNAGGALVPYQATILMRT